MYTHTHTHTHAHSVVIRGKLGKLRYMWRKTYAEGHVQRKMWKGEVDAERQKCRGVMQRGEEINRSGLHRN